MTQDITLVKGLWCSPCCDGRIEGTVRGKSVFVTLDQKTYRLSLKRIVEGDREIRGGWTFEKADNYTPEQLERMEEVARNWLD